VTELKDESGITVSRAQLSLLPILSLASLYFPCGSTFAQEVQWRSDYSAARKEAAATGTPLLLDFGTESCLWCKKLDATTFRDPKVVKLLNERFIPIKIDAQKEERLTSALKIEGFPTLILATADGKVIGRYAGYADVSELIALLSRAPALPTAVSPPAPSASPGPAAVPAALIAPPTPLTAAQKQQQRIVELDAGLSALFPEIAAALDR
jgi:thioredoxin-related protein